MKADLLRYFCLAMVAIGCAKTEHCPEKINLLPMYGNEKKCALQHQADSAFLHNMDALFHNNRKKASQDRTARAWDYFNNNIRDTAMMRFNQAWLLDTANADVYWGFGNLLGIEGKYKESLVHFNKSIQINPNNPIIWQVAAKSYHHLYDKVGEKALLHKSIEYLKQSLKLNPLNARTNATLASVYTYFPSPDSSKKYLAIAEQLDPSVVDPEIREIIYRKSVLKDKKAP